MPQRSFDFRSCSKVPYSIPICSIPFRFVQIEQEQEDSSHSHSSNSCKRAIRHYFKEITRKKDTILRKSTKNLG